MKHSLGMAEVNRVKNLVPPCVDAVSIKPHISPPDGVANMFAQVTLLAILHHDKKVCRLGVEVDERADMWMLQKKQ